MTLPRTSRVRLLHSFLLAAVGCAFGCSASNESKGVKPTEATTRTGCDIATAYPGDETCLVAPAADKGMQFHYGPADYANPDEVNEFVLQPGEELVDCMYLKAPNAEKIYFSEFENSLRPSSHHMIVNELSTDVAEGHRACALEAGTGDGGLTGAPFHQLGQRAHPA